MLVFASSGHAFMDYEDNSNTNQQGQSQGQVGINKNENVYSPDNTNQQGQAQGQIGINELDSDISNQNANTNFNSDFNSNEQGQQQGIDSEIDNKNTVMTSDFVSQGQDQGQLQGQQMGQGQVGINDQGQGQDQFGHVEVDDHSTYEQKVYHLAAPNTVASSGQKASSVYSIFGGLNLAQTEEAKHCMDVLNVIGEMQGAGYLTEAEAKAEAMAIFKQLKDATKSKRLLGILWKTRGHHLLNGLGLLSWDDLWGKVGNGGERVKRERVDTDMASGNRGYLKQ